MLLRHLFAVCLALLPAGIAPAATAQTDISIGFRTSAPYVIRAGDNSLSGLEYELVMQAANAAGMTPRALVIPFGRLPEDFRRGSIQAFVPANPAMNLPGCISDTVLVYRNMAFTLKSRGLTIASAVDLAALDVTAFQNAQLLLGPGVASLMLNPDRYREVANQMLQVRALFSGRTDVVLAERRLFRFMMRSPEAGVDTALPLAEHDIFPPTLYGVAFQRPDDCVSFNRGLATIRRSGVYDEVLRRWDSGSQARSGARPAANPAG